MQTKNRAVTAELVAQVHIVNGRVAKSRTGEYFHECKPTYWQDAIKAGISVLPYAHQMFTNPTAYGAEITAYRWGLPMLCNGECSQS